MGQLVAGRYALSEDPPRVGGLARVHRAVDVGANPPRNVAVKIIGALDNDDLVDLFFTKEVDALRNLQHPNIVSFLEAGRDPDSSEAFIVLEWVEGDLLDLLGDGPIPFDDFVGQIGLPLASALAAAHERQIIHRDVKPSNVLVTADGVPKLADFGISKIKTSLATSPHTTAEYMSRPYAPPERESTSSYTRDVYGFGVLMLRCLVGTPVADYPDIRVALDALDVSAELAGLIERCVDFDPTQRPSNASLLFAELNAIHKRRKAAWTKEIQVTLSMGRSAREWCESTLGLAPAQIESFVAEDLADAPAITGLATPDEAMGQLDGRQYYLYGSTLSYRIAVQADGSRPPSLFIMSIIQPELARLDRARDTCLVLDTVELRFGTPINHTEARAAIEQVVRLVDQYADSQQQAAHEREQQRLLEEWRRQIAARESIEVGRELPARYQKVEISGRRLLLTVTEGLPDVTVGEVRRVQGGDERRRGPILRGEVERIDDNVVTLYVDGEPEGVPTRGRLLVDTSAARIKIDREKAALGEVIHSGGDIVRPDLRGLIIDPSTSQPPDPAEIDRWFQPDLDLDKQHAVASALGCQDAFLVQGPPGTGKTTFIAELVAQELERNPRALILIASQTNVALDNALLRIARINSSARLIRLADAKATRVTADAQPFLLDNQMEAWREIVTVKSQAFLDEWCSIHGVPRETVRQALSLQELADLRSSEMRLEEHIDEAKLQLANIERTANPAQRESDLADVAEHRDELRRQQRTVHSDAAALWERLKTSGGAASLAGDAAPADLIAAASRLLEAAGGRADELKAFVRIQAEWLLRLGKGDEFVEPLLLGSQVLGATCVGLARYRALKSAKFDLCIIDEASKATATEVLVPMVRARRWVLVGDQRQLPPFQEEALGSPQVQDDHGLDPEELRRTLFDRFAESLPVESRVMLRTQRRMTAAIGELISACFYDGELLNEGPEPLGPVSGALPKPVTWFSTSKVPSRHEQADHFESTSYVNLEEAREVIAVLRRLGRWFRPTPEQDSLHVLVLAPYRAQIAQLRHRVAGVQPDLPGLNIEVNTIDAVQGREADIVIFSVTRSNPQNNLGFLGVEARANVALSRAQRGLVIIGDADFCRSKPGPLKAILDHIGDNPHNCVIEEVKP